MTATEAATNSNVTNHGTEAGKSAPVKKAKLVTGANKSNVKERTSILQFALAAEFAKLDYEVVEEEESVTEYPHPCLVLVDGDVLFEGQAAAYRLLGEDPFGSEAGKSLSAQLTRFASIQSKSENAQLKRSLTPEDAAFAAEFAKHTEVWTAASRAGLPSPGTRKVRSGTIFEYDWSVKRVPKEGERNVLITSALPYVNNVPHLGNVIGAVLSGDVFARYCRLRGYNIIYICGTDEYGTATETKALEEGTSCADVCAKYFRVHASIYEWFQIHFDIFGRTSTAAQTEITHDIFRKLYDNGFFFEQSMEQCYCTQCSRFLADRYVEGTCPLCGFHDARGDQCDGCGKLINPVELIDAKCKLCKTQPTVRSSRHLFLDLTKLQDRCAEFVEGSSQRGRWSANSAAIAKGWLTEGLKPRCMTRDLKWGTPVPVPGFEDKVFYVWFDAPIGYISITANYTEEWAKWWKNPENVQLYQFMGKDNVPFHTVIFPSTLLGTGDPFTLLHHINTTEYLNYESGKFSKSRGTGVFGNDARDSGIPAAVWRYYLLSTRPENNDSVFGWDDFAAKINTELLANLGNFVNRATKFSAGKLNSRIGHFELSVFDRVFIDKVNGELKEYLEAMEAVKLKSALRSAMNISALGNAYLQDNRLDNKLLVNDPQRCQTVIAVALNLCYLLSGLLAPFLPSTAEDICRILNAPSRTIPDAFTMDLLEGHHIGTPFHLFQRIDEGLVRELRAKYGGKQQI